MVILDRIAIARTAGQVFSFVSAYDNDVRWRAGVLRMVASGPTAVGTRTRETLKFLGSVYLTDGVVTAYEEGRVDFRGENPSLEASGYREVTPSEAGSIFTYALDLSPRGVLRWMLPLLRPLYAARIRRDLRRLKVLLEATTL